MKLNISYASIEEYFPIIRGYYNFYIDLFGPSIFRPIVSNAINKEMQPNPIFELLDKNYYEAAKSVDEAFGDVKDICLLRICSEDGNLLGYARIKWHLGEDEKNAGIIDVAVTTKMTYDELEEFYASFIKDVEEFILSHNDKTEMVTHEIPHNNDAYLDAIYNNGAYSSDESNEGSMFTYLFNSYVRNKPRERVRTSFDKK